MNDGFTIIIDINPTAYLRDFSKEKYSAYNGCKKKRDRITFNRKQIIIEGDRTKSIDPNALFTIKSTYSFDILKAFIYYLYTWSSFSVEKITFIISKYSGEEVYEYNGSDQIQDFKKNTKARLSEKELEEILELEDDQNSLIAAMTYQIDGYQQDNFDSTWKCFNRIYNALEKNTKDLASINKILVDQKDILKANEHLLKESKKFVDNLNDSRIIKWISYNNDIQSYRDNTGFNHYTDADLLQRLLEIFDGLISEGKLEGKLDKSQKGSYKNMEKQVSKNQSNHDSYNYLEFLIRYANFIRNKNFHGEYRKRIILNENALENEQKQLSNVIQLMNSILIKNNFNELINSKHFVEKNN